MNTVLDGIPLAGLVALAGVAGAGVWTLLARLRSSSVIASAASLLGRTSSPIECKGSLRLAPAHTLHLVHCLGRSWLVSCHAQGSTLIGSFADKIPAEAPGDSPGGLP